MTSVFAAAVVLSAGCKKEAPPAPAPLPPPAEPATFRVTSVDVGTGLNADKSISVPATTFGPRDTVFASVATDGAAAAATLRARFIFQTGQLVHQFSQPITASGPTRNQFRLWRASGWPVGIYRLEVFLDSLPAGSKEFEVKKP